MDLEKFRTRRGPTDGCGDRRPPTWTLKIFRLDGDRRKDAGSRSVAGPCPRPPGWGFETRDRRPPTWDYEHFPARHGRAVGCGESVGRGPLPPPSRLGLRDPRPTTSGGPGPLPAAGRGSRGREHRPRDLRIPGLDLEKFRAGHKVLRRQN